MAGILVEATAVINSENVYGNATTDSAGNYTITRCEDGIWTVTPVSGAYTFGNIASGSYGLYCDETDNYEFSPWIGHVDVEGKDSSADENFVGTPPES